MVRQIVGAANCPAAMPLVKFARNPGFLVDSGRIDCPVRFIWGTSDQLLRWPDTAVRFQAEWFPESEFVELDGVGHCPQLEVPAETAEMIAGTTLLA